MRSTARGRLPRQVRACDRTQPAALVCERLLVSVLLAEFLLWERVAVGDRKIRS